MSNDPQSDEALLERIGGTQAVVDIVNRMYEMVLADDELAGFFKNVDIEHTRKMQFEFLASALGGPVNYSGAELQAIHAGRGITPHHFSKFVGHFATSMEEQGVAPDDVDKMLGRMAMYRDRIIGGANVDG